MNQADVPAAADGIAHYCQHWKIRKLAVFGSILRDDFTPASDVDLLIEFEQGGGITFDNLPDIIDEASRVFGGRSVDIVEERFISNPHRRAEIMRTRRVIYEA